MGTPVVAQLGQAERLMTAWLQDSLTRLGPSTCKKIPLSFRFEYLCVDRQVRAFVTPSVRHIAQTCCKSAFRRHGLDCNIPNIAATFRLSVDHTSWPACFPRSGQPTGGEYCDLDQPHPLLVWERDNGSDAPSTEGTARVARSPSASDDIFVISSSAKCSVAGSRHVI